LSARKALPWLLFLYIVISLIDVDSDASVRR
jgi:hypothetical protein